MVTRLSGGLTPADGADPRTFPAIWNTTAGTIEAQGSAITVAEGDIASQGSAIAVLEGDSLPTDVVSPVSGDSLVYNGTDWVNGPRSGNAIINGDFGVWQRGTSFTGVVGSGIYTSDRWRYAILGGGSATIDRQSFTPDDVNAIGYGDAEYYLRWDTTDVTSMTTNFLHNRIEDVRTFAGQTVTVSFWAKASSSYNMVVQLSQQFGSGGSSAANVGDTVSLTTSWTRHSVTLDVASMSGKTIGASSYVELRFFGDVTATRTYDIWGVQLEAGSVATPFRPAGGGSKAAELALCQRYFQSYGGDAVAQFFGSGLAVSGTLAAFSFLTQTALRAAPTITFSNVTHFSCATPTGGLVACTNLTANNAATSSVGLTATIGSSLLAAGNGSLLRANTTDAKIFASAEL